MANNTPSRNNITMAHFSVDAGDQKFNATNQCVTRTIHSQYNRLATRRRLNQDMAD